MFIILTVVTVSYVHCRCSLHNGHKRLSKPLMTSGGGILARRPDRPGAMLQARVLQQSMNEQTATGAVGSMRSTIRVYCTAEPAYSGTHVGPRQATHRGASAVSDWRPCSRDLLRSGMLIHPKTRMSSRVPAWWSSGPEGRAGGVTRGCGLSQSHPPSPRHPCTAPPAGWRGVPA